MPFYYIEELGNADDARLCFFDSVPEGVEGSAHCFRLGLSVKAEYPEDAKLYMERHNRGIRLSDFIGNTRGMLLVSDPLRRLIAKHCAGADIEYLPLTIMDHKKRAHGKDYCIVNPLGGYDCADLETSELDRVSSGEVAFVDRLVLSQKTVSKAPQLFRFDLYPSMYIFGPALSEDIIANKLSNVFFHELEVTPK